MNSFKACREESGLTQKEVALSLKMSVQAISYWETGERMPSYEKLFQLADLYDVSLDKLLGRVFNPLPQSSDFTREEVRIAFSYRGLQQKYKDALSEYIDYLHAKQEKEKESNKNAAG